MKRSFSFKNQDPPMSPLDGSAPADAGDRDLEVKPEGGRFGELLVHKQLVSRGAILEALLQQTTKGKRLGSLLVEIGAITDGQLAETLAEQLQLPMADLRNDRPDPEAVAK
ncbi:MAG: type pilus assembly protein PilB, partial [Actinomycetota bacterium]|nr:type pilus assembly protein PilB [Actinomycetota bacterium]